jgi:nucleoside-diphosphate-sugar epimerase
MSPGDQIIDISYIDDIVAAYERLIEIFENGEIDINGKSFALYSDNRLTLKELACLYEKITNRELNINWGGRPYREREVMIPWENGEKIPGYRQNITVEEGIRRFVNE